ncbi:MAG TPA: endonuclease/exonuclease/phosphatase family protein [Chloroflexia bacterium]
MQPVYRVSRARKALIGLLSCYPLLVLGLAAIHLLAPQRSGALALSQIFAPYLFVPLPALLPFALLRGAGPLRVLLLLCALVFGVRYAPRLVPTATAAPPGATQVEVMNWNVRLGGQWDQVRPVLLSRPADVITLEEITWRRLVDDKMLVQLYPYHVVYQPAYGNSEVLLSAYPILDQGALDPEGTEGPPPRMVWARLDLGEGRTLVVVGAHPYTAKINLRACPRTRCYDPSTRDAQIARIRAFFEPILQQGEPLIVSGDFNVTEREPAYADLARGLLAVQRQVGWGLGLSWGMDPTKNQPIPWLRIDHMFSSPNVTPVRTSVDCTLRGSDHCIVHGTFAVP